MEVTRTSTEFGCAVTFPVEMWVDQAPPHRQRTLDELPFRPDAGRRAIACTRGTPIEAGAANGEDSLRFEPPDALVYSGPPQTLAPNPVAALRDAIADGTARLDGRAEVDGRIVERIRYESTTACPGSTCPPHEDVAYVDPETFAPVRFDWPYGLTIVPAGPYLHFHVVQRFLTYEYLPRTAANLALTDIRAQHPDATGP